MKSKLLVENVLSLEAEKFDYTFVKPGYVNKGKVVVIIEDRRSGHIETKVCVVEEAGRYLDADQEMVLLRWIHKPPVSYRFTGSLSQFDF